MICPTCHTEMQIMEVVDKYHEIVKVSRCPHCGSFWLDQHELSRLDAGIVEEIDTVFPDPNNEQIPGDCPRCHIPLEKSNEPKPNNVVMEVCKECKGIFMKSGDLAKYFGLQPKVSSHVPDKMGLFSSRDRILTSIISIIILLSGAGIAISQQTGYGALSADSLISTPGIQPVLLYLLIAVSILVFIIGLILTFSKQGKAIRLLGWSAILLAIALIFILSI
ncbi:MAG: zf-TFIIB domain-containing protein [bacterium]|nr:zf-TFIIB domain-containing protein [bacterium]